MFEKLGKNLDLLMSQKRLTSVQLAAATGIPASTIKKIRSHANTNPTLGTVIPLAQHFSISLEKLINGNVLEPGTPSISVLPVIQWDELLTKESALFNTRPFVIVEEKQVSTRAFAVRLEMEVCELFPRGSILLVEPIFKPSHNDFVIIHKKGQQRPSIKQFLYEDEAAWLKSLYIEKNISPLTESHSILGVITECRMSFSKVREIYSNGSKNNLRVLEVES